MSAAGAGGSGGILIHIGYPKAGSSYLRRWFGTHPALVLGASTVADGRQWRVISDETLATPTATDADGRLLYAPGTSQAAAQGETCRRLRSEFPDARVLMVTRGFRAMFLSSFSQYVRTGGAMDFEAFVAAVRGTDVWHYDRMAALYRETFGAGQVLVLPFEALRDAPEAFTGRVEAWLGIGAHRPQGGAENVSLSGVELRWYPRLARTASRAGLATRYRRGVFGNRYSAFIGLLQRVRPAAPVTAEAVAEGSLDLFRGQADALSREPAFRPYARDYLAV